MVHLALNHMTVARLGFAQLVDLAAHLGCVGIEARNDLPQPLFDGMPPADAGALVRDRGLRLLALAEVKRFNDWSADKAAEALALMRTAQEAGAEAVALIPRNDGLGLGNGERQANLRVALRELAPMLRDHGLKGYVEPLGFAVCALRHKGEAVEAIEALGAADVVALVHDTFHHHLADDGQGAGPIFPTMTGIVHVSGVTDPVAAPDMSDAHRGLVDARDRLGNVAQVRALIAAGWNGPISVEAFSPAVHADDDPGAALARCFEFLRSEIAAIPVA
jgi:2-keto-myo-inositol isomerase